MFASKHVSRHGPGTIGLRVGQVFMGLHTLLLFGMARMILAEGLDTYFSHFGQNLSRLLSLEGIISYAIELVPVTFMAIGGLVLALIALFGHKNQKAKPTVVFGIVLIVVTCFFYLGL